MDALPVYITVVFDDENEYVRFTDDIYCIYNGAGLQFTNSTNPLSLRLTEELYQLSKSQYHMRQPAPAEQKPVIQPKSKPFDPSSLKNFRVPGATG